MKKNPFSLEPDKPAILPAETTVRRVVDYSVWDLRMLAAAKLFSSWSKDPSTRVGALLVDSSRRFVSMGYNGFAAGLDDSVDRLSNREYKYGCVLHAEENVFFNATAPLFGTTLYTYPMPPCSKCTAAAIQVGVIRIVSVSGHYRTLSSDWKEKLEWAREMCEQVSIPIVLYPLEQVSFPDDALFRFVPSPDSLDKKVAP